MSNLSQRRNLIAVTSPSVCTCKGKKHSANCGCFRDFFVQSAWRNLYCALSQCENKSAEFAARMWELGKYYAQDIHQWEDRVCDFHSRVLCSCGNCEDNHACEGNLYHTSNVLSCPLHALAYEIECCHRADYADEIIDPELGKGHSNACEATFTVFPKLRPKDIALQELHY